MDPEEEESSEEETRGARRGIRRGLTNKRSVTIAFVKR